MGFQQMKRSGSLRSNFVSAAAEGLVDKEQSEEPPRTRPTRVSYTFFFARPKNAKIMITITRSQVDKPLTEPTICFDLVHWLTATLAFLIRDRAVAQDSPFYKDQLAGRRIAKGQVDC